jgi:hypothetical protein
MLPSGSKGADFASITSSTPPHRPPGHAVVRRVAQQHRRQQLDLACRTRRTGSTKRQQAYQAKA